MKPEDIDVPEVAKLVRKVLAREFPKTKFSVVSERYRTWPGGGSLTICYDGEAEGAPSKEEVRDLVKGYQGSTFDGMTDSRSYLYHWLLPDLSTRKAKYHPDKKDLRGPKGARLVAFATHHITVSDYPS
jgi:hypothetical protein